MICKYIYIQKKIGKFCDADDEVETTSRILGLPKSKWSVELTQDVKY